MDEYMNSLFQINTFAAQRLNYVFITHIIVITYY